MAELSFCGKDAAEVEAAVLTGYERVSGRTLYPGDPVRLFLEAVAAELAQQRVLIDFSAKMNLLRFSKGAYMEALGELVGTDRLAAARAHTTLRFSMEGVLPFAVTIPAGTRATAGGALTFETTQAGEIPVGETFADLDAACLISGAAGNGLVPGQVNMLVDPVPYVAEVRNVTLTEGGADVEDDERYRERIHEAPESFAVAGPYGAYRHWAMTAHQSISDVAVWSPEPGVVEVRPLCVGGVSPGPEILEEVVRTLDDEKRRPLTDEVRVRAPERVPYDVRVSYWIDRSDATRAEEIRRAADRAVAEYVLWQKSRMGRDVNPTDLIARLRTAGVKRVLVEEPAFRVLSPSQAAMEASVEVLYGGLEDG
jgi:phage-related baseplate assembly protein